MEGRILFIYLFYKQGTFHGHDFRTFHGDLNIGVLTAPQQQTPGKFRVSLEIRFKPKTMCHLLRPHFPLFALINWATLVGEGRQILDASLIAKELLTLC